MVRSARRQAVRYLFWFFKDMQLNTALAEMTSEDIAADIITLIRRYAIGSHLLSHEERIKGAVARLKKAHSFSAQEFPWLKRIKIPGGRIGAHSAGLR